MDNKPNKDKKKKYLVFPDQYGKDYEANSLQALKELRYGSVDDDPDVADDESCEMVREYLKSILMPSETTYVMDYERYEDVQKRIELTVAFFRRLARQSLSDEPVFDMKWTHDPIAGGALLVRITQINDHMFNQSMAFTKEELELLANIIGPDAQVEWVTEDDNIVCIVEFAHIKKLIDSKQ